MPDIDEKYLPKEPLDLPRPPLDLPDELPKDLPAGRQEVPVHTPEHHESKSAYTDVKTLLSWKAPGRPFRKRKKEYYTTVLLFALVFEVLAFLFSFYLLMVVIAAVAFLAMAFAYVPPGELHYRISTEGITVGDHFYLWQELYDFYFMRREDQDVLHIRTLAMIPGELVITLGDIHKDQVKSVMLGFLPYREHVTLTFMEKSGDWLSRTFPV